MMPSGKYIMVTSGHEATRALGTKPILKAVVPSIVECQTGSRAAGSMEVMEPTEAVEAAGSMETMISMGASHGLSMAVSLFQCLKLGVDCSLYVDDFKICYRLSNVLVDIRYSLPE